MVFGLRLSAMTRAELARSIERDPVPAGTGPRIVCTANVDHVVHLHTNAAFRTAYGAAWAVTADGMPVYAYARMRRERVPGRVTGSDLVNDLVRGLSPRLHRCCFITSRPDIAEALERDMVSRGFPADSLRFVVPPFGFENNLAYSAELARDIGRRGTTHLFVGVGAPKSEIWTDRYRALIGDCYVLNAGAGLEYSCGLRRRAPRWIQHSGFEWMWRFCGEPRRLFRRYFVDSWTFLAAIRRDLRGGPQRCGEGENADADHLRAFG